VPAIRLDHLTEAEARAYVIADNRLAELAGWDEAILAEELRALQGEGFDLLLTGWEGKELDELLFEPPAAKTGADDAPPVREEAKTKVGDVWVLGAHRVMCGDSTSAADVGQLMAGEKAQLIHADPPYGMGKQADGVANDNIYNEELDHFQMKWWAAFRSFTDDNGSAYIWGNAPDLWRLWYRGGLSGSERLELRNHIVWDKKAIPGMASDLLTQFPIASEHCLFFQIGDQVLTSANINTDAFPDDWEPVRDYLEREAIEAGVVPADIKRICGVGMYGHWFTRSQFTLIPEKHYRTLAEAFPGFFLRPWADLKAEWDRVRAGPVREINEARRSQRSYFDNAHDSMRDTWEFPRVTGDERHGHATPKPVAMMERVMKSSLPLGGLCAEPFGGSGSTLIGAETTGRRCYTMELQPKYCDVIVRRWQNFTGQRAVHAVTGEPSGD